MTSGDPIPLFHEWQREARGRFRWSPRGVLWGLIRWLLGPELPRKANVAVLATSTSDGSPSARVVDVKHVDDEGFLFFTNARSRKGLEIIENPRASLVYHWLAPPRQVRIEGEVRRAPEEESDAHWNARSRASQLAAIVSNQSQALHDRSELVSSVVEHSRELGGRPIRRPDHWGGFRLVPQRIEFWEGHPDRLHRRILHERQGERWTITELAP